MQLWRKTVDKILAFVLQFISFQPALFQFDLWSSKEKFESLKHLDVYYMSRAMRKPVFAIQQRRRSSRAFLYIVWPSVPGCCSTSQGSPGISMCRLQHVVSVESSSLFHHSIYL